MVAELVILDERFCAARVRALNGCVRRGIDVIMSLMDDDAEQTRFRNVVHTLYGFGCSWSVACRTRC